MQHVLITGAASGFGAALTAAFVDHGWFVTATDINIVQLRDNWPELPEPLHLLEHDVSNWGSWKRVAAAINHHPGLPDLLINNAGLIDASLVQETSPEAIERLLAVNTKGVLFGTRMAAGWMVPARHGHIINISSMAGVAPIPGISLYSATKFAVRGYSLAAAIELRPKGVYVTCICPDAALTPMVDEVVGEESANMIFSGGSLLTPEDIVAAVFSAFRRKPKEILLPGSRGITAKLASLWPDLGAWVADSLWKKGERQRRQFGKS